MPPLATRKALSLFAYLVLHSDVPRSREELATLFWGDTDDTRSRRSLATALWRIRQLLAQDDLLLADSVTVQFNPDRRCWIDVNEFSACLHAPVRIENLQRAVDLYRGDLLEGFYDDWCLEHRFRFEAMYLDALCQLIESSEAGGDFKAMLAYAEKALARDPLQENLYLAAMRAYCALGDRTSARRQWIACCRVRLQELDAYPSAEMLRQAERVLGDSITVPLVIADRAQSPAGTTLRHGNFERTPFVGRSNELRALLDRWGEAVNGKGGLVLITGEAGVGKSRLAEEFMTAVRGRGGITARGRCWEPERGVSYQPIADILRVLFASTGQEVWPAMPAWIQAELSFLVPDLVPPVGAKPVGHSPGRGRQPAFLLAIAEAICRLARGTPLLLVLEDLHCASDSTLAAIHYLARQAAGRGMLIVGTYRSFEADQMPALQEMAAQLAREGIARNLTLERLSQTAVADLLLNIGGGEFCDGFVRQLYEHTDGNALFLVETLRELEAAGSIAAKTIRGAAAAGLGVPPTVHTLIQARLCRLNPATRELVDCASVAGRAFDFDLICRVLGVGEEAALQSIDELLRSGILREGNGLSRLDYEFEHSLIHQVVYAGLHHRRRRRFHRRIGEMIEELYPEKRAELASTLAHHFDQAAIGDKALDYAAKAAARAWDLCAIGESASYLDVALQWLERIGRPVLGERAWREKRFDLIASREQVIDILARRSDQAPMLQELAELAEALDDDVRRAQVHVRRFWHHYPEDVTAARGHAERALGLAGRVQAPALLVQSLYIFGLALARLGDLPGALTFAQRSVEKARSLGDRMLEGWSLLQQGYILKELGEIERAQASLERSAELARTSGNLFALSRALVHLGDVCRLAGRRIDAEEHLRQALALGRELGYRWTEEDALKRLSLISR